MASTNLSVKLTFGSVKRRFSLSPDSTYNDLKTKLVALFPDTPFVITYHDNENDLVTISSQEELQELFSLAQQYNLNPIRLHLYKPEDDIPDTAPAQPTQEQPTQEQPSADRSAEREASGADTTPFEAIFSGIAEVMSAMGGSSARAGGRRSCHWNRGGRGRFAGRRGGRPGFGGGRPGFGGPRGPPPHPPPPPFGRFGFGPFDGFMSMFLGNMMSGLAGVDVEEGTGVFSRWGDISEATKNAFHELMNTVRGLENRDDLMNVAMSVMPIVREFMANGLGQEGEVAQSAVDGFVRDVRNACQGLGEQVGQRVEELIRAAMGDEAVVQMLRGMRGMDMFEMRMPFEGRVGGGREGFSVHRRIECDACGISPIVGTRYKCTNRSNYDICGACHRNDTVNTEGMEFKECKYVWEGENDGVVPQPPLQMGDRGANVAFLQKTLTDLGYMNESMYSWRVGMFGPNTRQGVLQFQREYGLTSEVEEGVYDATTAASLSSVLESQVPPSATAGGASASAAEGSSSTAPQSTA